MHRLLAPLMFFTSFCIPLLAAGENRWWELYSPAEQKKLFMQYEGYLYPGAKKSYTEFLKAVDMYAATPPLHSKLIGAAIAWRNEYDKADKKTRLQVMVHRQFFLDKLILLDTRHKGTVVAKMPDSMAADFFWAYQNFIDEKYLTMVTKFGKRAGKHHDEIRDYMVSKGADADQIKSVLSKIR